LLALQASKKKVMSQIEDGIKQIPPSTKISTASFALIIDGKSIPYALEDDVKFKFLDLAINCASVICCRSSPKQKALVRFLSILKFPSLSYVFSECILQEHTCIIICNNSRSQDLLSK
jgi:hypothetical protein